MRIERLKTRLLQHKPSICVERAILITESYQGTEGEPECVRRAKALRRVLNRMSISINPDELIVGNQASQPRAAPLFPEFSISWLARELDDLPTRQADPFYIDGQKKDVLRRRVFPYWQGKTVEERARNQLPEEVQNYLDSCVFILTGLNTGIGHINPGYDVIIRRGLLSIKEELEQRCIAEPQRKDFYEAGAITCAAAIEFANRYADLAREMSRSEPDAQRRRELEAIERVCRRVPAYPAETFHEAVQCFWFLQLIIQLESNGHSVSPGRFDQYMYPYYRRDIQSSRLDRDHAAELLGCLWVKLNEINKVRDKIGAMAFGGYPMFQNLILGGQTQYGGDATNELSYLCLEATRRIRLPQPSLSVRWHEELDQDFLRQAIETVKIGLGMPAFFNDHVIVKVLDVLGYPTEEAWNYAITGCVQPQLAGMTQGFYNGGFMNLAKCLELALNNGYDPIKKRQIAPKTGALSELTTFAEVWRALDEQLSTALRLQAEADNIIEKIHAEYAPSPFLSLMVSDCIDRGLPVEGGGARYNFTAINAVGLANVADSLAALRIMVYDKKQLSLELIRKLLQEDFCDHEDIRMRLLNDVPKYGNDCQVVDNMAESVFELFCTRVGENENARGGTFVPGFQSISAHALFRGHVGATPDGRKALDLLSDGGVSAAQGRDRNGPTALLNSVLRLDHTRALNGSLLNVKLHPSTVGGEKGSQGISALINTFFTNGGQHIQFNVVDAKTLREAQQFPELYSTLLVRVSGFSVFFTELDRTLQEDIIARTEHLLC
ncbi:MAG: glycyl radical protein [Firmicutes bacterium]|nr:glycyl radical protein [Candidatus Fermentithermobacillaceae bacterium]